MIALDLRALALLISDFVAKFDDTYTADFADEFSSEPFDGCVYWSLLYCEGHAAYFYDDFCKRFPAAADFSYFTLALLHEIGHCETVDEMENDVEKRNSIRSMQQYVKLKNERLATDWAGWWLTNNIEAAHDFDNKVTKLLKEFYIKHLDKMEVS